MTNAYRRAYTNPFGQAPAITDDPTLTAPDPAMVWAEIIAMKMQIGDLQAKITHMERMIDEHGNGGWGASSRRIAHP